MAQYEIAWVGTLLLPQKLSVFVYALRDIFCWGRSVCWLLSFISCLHTVPQRRLLSMFLFFSWSFPSAFCCYLLFKVIILKLECWFLFFVCLFACFWLGFFFFFGCWIFWNVDQFFLSFLLLFKYNCLHCPPIPPTHASTIPTSHPQSYLSLALSMCPLYMFLDDTFPVSDYIVLACLFCWLGSTYKWDHMVFLFHHLACFT